MYLYLPVDDLALESPEEREEILPGTYDEILDLHLPAGDASVEDGVPHIAVPELRLVRKALSAVRADQAKVDGRGGLELDLEKLARNIRELAGVMVLPTREHARHHLVDEATAVPFLNHAGVIKGLADERIE